MKIRKFHIKRVLTTILITIMIAMTLLVYPASAQGTRVYYQNYNIACTVVSLNQWVGDDGVVYIRDEVLNSIVTSTSDYFAGPGHIYGNANLSDPAFGIGTYFGSLDIFPTVFPGGYWFGHWNMQISADGYHGIAVLKGYGSLAGMWTYATLTPLPPVVLVNFSGLCGGNQPAAGTYVEGYYMLPDEN